MRLLKFIFIVLGILILPNLSYSQQEPQYTWYMFNQMQFNPAYSGTRNGFCAGLVNHQQWQNFKVLREERKPVTSGFYAHNTFFLSNGNKIGAGLTAVSDVEGFINATNIHATVSYHKQLPFAMLSLGLNAGLMQKNMDPDWVARDNGDTKLPPKSDGSAVDFGLGAWLYNPNYYVGISALHLTAPEISFGGNNVTYNVAPVMYLTAGYNFTPQFLPQDFQLQPSVLIKRDVAKYQFDATAATLYKSRFYGGFNYRYRDAVSLLAGLYLFDDSKKGALFVGYSHDITTSQLRGTGNVNEFTVRYCKTLEFEVKQGPPFRDVRFL